MIALSQKYQPPFFAKRTGQGSNKFYKWSSSKRFIKLVRAWAASKQKKAVRIFATFDATSTENFLFLIVNYNTLLDPPAAPSSLAFLTKVERKSGAMP